MTPSPDAARDRLAQAMYNRHSRRTANTGYWVDIADAALAALSRGGGPSPEPPYSDAGTVWPSPRLSRGEPSPGGQRIVPRGLSGYITVTATKGELLPPSEIGEPLPTPPAPPNEGSHAHHATHPLPADRFAAPPDLQRGVVEKVRDFVAWHQSCDGSGLIGDSRVAMDGQTRVLKQLLWWLEHGDDYLDACIDLVRKQTALRYTPPAEAPTDG